MSTDLERQALEKEIRTHERITLLGRMAGIKSVARNLKNEDARVWQNVDDDRSDLRGGEDCVKTSPFDHIEDDDLEVMAGGDVYINHPGLTKTETAAVSTTPQPAPAPAPPPPPTASPVKPLSGLFKLGMAALAAAGISGPAGLVYWLMRDRTKIVQPQQPTTTQPPPKQSTGPSFGIGLLPPDKP